MVTVDYTYAFSGDYGAATTAAVAADEAALEAELGPPTVTTFAQADLAGAHHQVIEISDSGIVEGDLALAPDANLLVIQAADGQRPVLTGNLTITGVAGASVTLRALGVGGSLTVTGAGPVTVTLEHCTVRGNVDWTPGVSGTLVLDHSLCGPLLAGDGVDVSVADSVVDAGSDDRGGGRRRRGRRRRERDRRPEHGRGHDQRPHHPAAREHIVTGPVVSAERQAGCVRYSFVPLTGSQTPVRFRCQPDLESATEVAAALAADPALDTAQSEAITTSVEGWLLPAFTSRTPGQPGYLRAGRRRPRPDPLRGGRRRRDGRVLRALLGPPRGQPHLSGERVPAHGARGRDHPCDLTRKGC